MTRNTGWKAGVGAALAVAVLGVAVATGMVPGGTEARGEKAPAVAVQLLHGGIISLEELEGQVVLVNFWATWCPPCRVEIPGFQRVWEARRDDGFTILGLSADRLPDEQILWFLEQRGIDYMVGRATLHTAEAFGGARTLPTSILIDADGRMRRTVVGVYPEEELVADVDGLLREAGLTPTGAVAEAPRASVPGWPELTAVGHPLGEEDAPVTVVEFSDYGCAYCRGFTLETFPQVYAEFIEAGRVRWVHVPFVLGKFANSDAASVAASCAAEQGDGRFWTMHMALFRGQREWRSGDPVPVFRHYLEEAGGDVAAFTACWEESRPRAKLDRAEQMAAAAGVSATPTFFIDGRRVEGAAPPAEFRQALLRAEEDR